MSVNLNNLDCYFIACQDKKILGLFDTEEEARKEVLDEIERDKFWLVLKRRLLKRKLLQHKKLHFAGHLYFVAKIIHVEEGDPDEYL